MKVFAFLTEPANYTLDLIEHVYQPRGIQYQFIHAQSLASQQGTEALVSLSLRQLLKYIFGILKENDAIILNGYTGHIPLIVILINALFFKKPMAIDSDTELQIPQGMLKRALKWCYLHFLFTRSYCFGFAGGNYGHKELFRYYGMAEERIRLAPMMVNNAQYTRELPIVRESSSPFRFGYVGRLVSIKQVDQMIEAMRQLKVKGIEAEFVVVGDGEERARLEVLAESLPIRFMGALFGDEKIKVLHSLDCLLLYSLYEPWGLVINEALASGIPVIVSNRIGARRDLVEGNCPTGLVAAWDNAEELAQQMIQMVNDQPLWQTFCDNAVQRMQQWDYDFYGQQFDGWLKDIAK
jgi:glycosyltransferase involved in cell wall biosynthesis